MYFQIDNSPQDPRCNRESKKCAEETNARLTLAPFSPPPVVTFENTLIGSTAVKTLEIFNPSSNCLKLSLTKGPPLELGLQLSWDEVEVGPSEQTNLKLAWRPIGAVSQRFTMQVVDSRKARFDIIVICKSFAKKKLLPNPPNRKKSLAPDLLRLKKSPKLSGYKKPSPKNKIYSTYEEVKKYESSTTQSNFTQSITYHKSPMRNSNPQFNNSRVSEYWSENDEHATSRRETYLVSNTLDFDKENFSQHITPPKHKMQSANRGKSDSNLSPTMSVLSAIENLEFTPLKICEKLFSKPSCDAEIINAGNTFNVTDSPRTGKRNRIPLSPNVNNIDSLIDNMAFTPLHDNRKRNNIPNHSQINKRNLKNDFSEESCVFTYEHVEKSSVVVKETMETVHYELHVPNGGSDEFSMNCIEQNSAPTNINITHPIIDLLDSTNFSKADYAELSHVPIETEQRDIVTQRNRHLGTIPIITLDDSERVNSKTDYDYSQFTPVTRNLSSLNDSLQNFNPKRCSTERKECNKNLVFSPHDIPCSGLNLTYERLSSGTYTKGESPIVPIDPANRECLQSSPYAAEISPLCSAPEHIVPTQRSCPRKLPFSECSKGFNERTELRNAIKEKNSMNGTKSIIEANQWQTSPPRAISPGALASIPEESAVLQESSRCDDTSKRVQCETFIVNKTFDTYKPIIKPISESVREKTCSRQDWKIKGTTKQDVTELFYGSSLGEQLANESYDYMNIRKVASTVDPFLASTCLYDKRAYEEMENEFKMWLNYLLTPPAELDSNTDSSKIDIGKTWLENRNKAVPAAPTKEQVSSKYHTSHRLESLRRSARAFIKNPKMSDVFIKVSNQIERKLLSIRNDKNLQMDIGLQKIILRLLLCYNPLWLRIGLEALYGRNVPLSSNGDVMGLSEFIIQRMFRDPYLASKFPAVSKVYTLSYTESIKKFTLKKFFFLVYFLDQAKRNKLIPHDPCLFCRNAEFKESRQILFQFTKELLSGVGDITKHLKPTGYEVSHKQCYLDEFKYAVHNLAVDLQDGVRLTRLMEIILVRDNLTSGLRTPAISLTQKFHNVKIALTALELAGFEIVGDITSKDIAKGHREKTLSLLWQIINKFRAPLFVNAATVIQRWWRTKIEKVRMERQIIYERQMKLYNSATKIQSWWKSIITRRKYVTRLQTWTLSSITVQRYWRMWQSRIHFLKMKTSAVIIQKWYRDRLLIRSAMNELSEKRRLAAAVKIQLWYRKRKQVKLSNANNRDRENFLRVKNATVCLQKAFRSYMEMKKTMKVYAVIRTSTIKIQQYYRATVIRRTVRREYLQLKMTTVILQKRLRANILMKQCKTEYGNVRNAAIAIQRFYKNYVIGRQVQSEYKKLKMATLSLQIRYRARLSMKKERSLYLKQRESVILIQKYFRSYKCMKYTQTLYSNQKRSAAIIQNRFRAYIAMKEQKKNFINLKLACIVVQKYLRAKFSMNLERQKFIMLKEATLTVQRHYRARLAMKTEQNKFLQIKHSTAVIQMHYRGFLAMKEAKLKYEALREACVKIQIYYRAYTAMKKEHQKYLDLKSACCRIQSLYRANRDMKNERQKYLQLKSATVIIQKYYRAQVSMKQQQTVYCDMKTACVTIQNYFRGYIAMKRDKEHYIKVKKAACVLQTRLRANRAMKIERANYLKLKTACQTIQTHYRAGWLVKEQNKKYEIKKCAANTIQKHFRAYLTMRTERIKYLQLRSSCVIIQTYIRAFITMKRDKEAYERIKQATLTIQTFYRARLAMKNDNERYLKLKHAAVVIQNYYRSRLVMKLQMKEYAHVKLSVLTIQTYFRAYLTMKVERGKYLKLKYACQVIQVKYRARLSMNRDYKQFNSLKCATLVIQNIYRAQLAMRKERKTYVELKNACIIVQRRYRAKRDMTVLRREYITERTAAIKIQTWYRSIVQMRTVRRQYVLLKISTIKMQRILRNNILAVSCRQDYIQLKDVCILVQRRFRSQILMRQCSEDYVRMKSAAVVIQKCFRTYLLRRRFLKLKEMTVKMQDRYRSSKIARSNRRDYLVLKSAAQFVQSKYKSITLMRITRQSFVERRTSVVIIQRFFRSYLMMKRERQYYLSLQHVTSFVQTHYRNKMLAIDCRKRYMSTVSSVLKIQAFFRMYRARKRYLLMKKATVHIQRYFRNYLLAKTVKSDYQMTRWSVIRIQSYIRAWILRKKYLTVRHSIIMIQRAYRNMLQLEIERKCAIQRNISAVKIQSCWRRYVVQSRYMQLKRSTVLCQRRRRATLVMRRERNSYRCLRQSTIKIQSAVCNWLTKRADIRKKCQSEEAKHIRRVNNAATTIQSHWRGYSVRKVQEENCKVAKLRRRWQDGALQSNQPTLAERNEDALDVLCHFKDVASVIRAFKTLDYVTSVIPMLYGTKETACPIIDRLVMYMGATNRSVSTLETLQLGVAILMNFTKFRPTAHFVYSVNTVNTLLMLMLRWCDKDNLLSRQFCTLLWLFGKYDDIKKEMMAYLSDEKQYKVLCRVRCLLVRKKRMDSKKRNQQPLHNSLHHSLSLNDSRLCTTPVKAGRQNKVMSPATEPDYGIRQITERRKIFGDEIEAIDSVFFKFNLKFNIIPEN